MKVLSLLQPWATLVVTGIKQIETRSWLCTYRGPLLIHASKGRAGKNVACGEPFNKFVADFKHLPFGYIIGKVTLVDVIKVDTGNFYYTQNNTLNTLTIKEKAFGDYTPGRFAWILEDPIKFKKPLKVKGNLNLWVFDEKLIDESPDWQKI